MASYWEVADEHPLCSRHDTGDFRALKLSDFMSPVELHRSRIYARWFHPLGVEHELNVAIPSPLWHTKTFLFDRHRRDFTERDRLLLDLLQPHLRRLWRAAQTRRRLQVAVTALDQGSEQDNRGVIFLTSAGRIEFASPTARRLLQTYFGTVYSAELPLRLADWVESGAKVLVHRHDPHRLTVDRSGDFLLLVETRDELRLTTRERQILAWVARGKTNPQIAETLSVAPSTVRKHLEHVYEKLGVRSRTAAVTRFLGVLERDESMDR